MTRKEITDAFNSLSLDARKEYFEALKAESKTQYDKFIKDLGDQAVQDFWDNERELIKQGKGTRDWTIEQQQTIMNMGKNGEELTHNRTAQMIQLCSAFFLEKRRKCVIFFDFIKQKQPAVERFPSRLFAFLKQQKKTIG